MEATWKACCAAGDADLVERPSRLSRNMHLASKDVRCPINLVRRGMPLQRTACNLFDVLTDQ
jgi:hypothetical protein